MVVDQDNFYSKSEYSHYLFGMEYHREKLWSIVEVQELNVFLRRPSECDLPEKISFS